MAGIRPGEFVGRPPPPFFPSSSPNNAETREYQATPIGGPSHIGYNVPPCSRTVA